MLSVIAAYLIGSIPFALLVARRWGARDLRLVGSGNLGATNVFRVSGFVPGLLVAILDAAKGAMSVLLAERMSGAGGFPAAAGVAAVLGHVFPVWTGFRGGKGVATAAGAFSILSPAAAAAAFVAFLIGTGLTRFVSLGSMLASALLPPLVYLTGGTGPVFVAACVVAGVILLRHRTNVIRLRQGTEGRVA